MLTVQGEPLSVSAAILGNIAGLPITNTMTMAALDIVVFLLLCVLASRFVVKNPGKVQIAVEQVLQMITGLIEQVVGDRQVAWRVMPLVATLVLFILVSNLIATVLPVLTGFTYEGQALFRSHTNDFNTTVALAFGMVALAQFYSIRKNNVFRHLGKYFQIAPIIAGFRKGIGEGFMAIIGAFIGLLDIVGEVAKVVSLSLRLFGNMFAGELLVGVLMTILAIALPVPIMLLATLSGVIQAIVFGSLVASSLGGVLKEE